jgi:RNA ligase (TIGR02306 family)
MSSFGVICGKISDIKPHFNADSLVLAKIEGCDFQFIVKKDHFSIGSKCIYFMLESILPESITDRLGLTGKLRGAHKNRVKTIRLRGEISQGIVCTPESIGVNWDNYTDEEGPARLAAELNVIKYEEPEEFVNAKGGQAPYLKPLPSYLTKYDIEGCDRFADVANELMDEQVIIHEKIEGSNLSVSVDENGHVFVNQRNFTVDKSLVEGEHLFWAAAERSGLVEAVQNIAKRKGLTTVYAELIGPGVQGNWYELQKHEVRCFDIKHADWVSAADYDDYPELKAIPWAPTIGMGKLAYLLDGKTIKDYSSGMSKINPSKLREGIVIKPMVEMKHRRLGGRFILKQRDPIYLEKSGH